MTSGNLIFGGFEPFETNVQRTALQCTEANERTALVEWLFGGNLSGKLGENWLCHVFVVLYCTYYSRMTII